MFKENGHRCCCTSIWCPHWATLATVEKSWTKVELKMHLPCCPVLGCHDRPSQWSSLPGSNRMGRENLQNLTESRRNRLGGPSPESGLQHQKCRQLAEVKPSPAHPWSLEKVNESSTNRICHDGLVWLWYQQFDSEALWLYVIIINYIINKHQSYFIWATAVALCSSKSGVGSHSW